MYYTNIKYPPYIYPIYSAFNLQYMSNKRTPTINNTIWKIHNEVCISMGSTMSGREVYSDSVIVSSSR